MLNLLFFSFYFTSNNQSLFITGCWCVFLGIAGKMHNVVVVPCFKVTKLCGMLASWFLFFFLLNMQLKNRDAFVFKYLWLPSKGRRLRALPGLPLQDQRCWSQQLGQASAPRCWTFPHLIPPLGYTNEWICCSLHPNCGLFRLHFAPGQNKSEIVFYREILETLSLRSALCAPKHRLGWLLDVTLHWEQGCE